MSAFIAPPPRREAKVIPLVRCTCPDEGGPAAPWCPRHNAKPAVQQERRAFALEALRLLVFMFALAAVGMALLVWAERGPR